MNTFSVNRCIISDKWQYNGMQVVWLENDLIKVGLLAGRGADIFEFRYKPRDVNFLLRLPGEIKNPRNTFAQRRDTLNQMEDYYYERYATQNAPWWGRAYAIALEPWTSKWTDNPEAAIQKGEWLKLEPNEKEQATVKAFPIVK